MGNLQAYKYVLMALILHVVGCTGAEDSERKPSSQGGHIMAMTLSSPAFIEEGLIPPTYTCDGEDISPPLTIGNIPDRTQSIALIADDPDAPMGTWVHWVMYNLPADIADLPENIPGEETIAGGGRHGITDFGRFGYGGPCPPSGTHRYYFKVYALDTVLDLTGRVTSQDVDQAMAGHILAEAGLMGKYKRR
jgi:Raf kinase inhibitor-like YbhB/YbcL family protein